MNLSDFSGVGVVTLNAMAVHGIHLSADFLTVFPRSYKDTRILTDIVDIDVDKRYLIEGVVSNVTYNSFGKKFLRFVVNDGTGACEIVLFRFYPNQVKIIENTEYIRCYGQTTAINKRQMIHPDWAVVSDDTCTIDKNISAQYNLKKISDLSIHLFLNT